MPLGLCSAASCEPLLEFAAAWSEREERFQFAFPTRATPTLPYIDSAALRPPALARVFQYMHAAAGAVDQVEPAVFVRADIV